jgi:tRNA_anti-like
MRLAPLPLACSLLLTTSSLGGPPRDDKGVPQLKAEEVSLAYQLNEAFVDEHLANRPVQISGPVVRVYRVASRVRKGDAQYVVVLGSNKGLPVHCYFAEKDRKRLAALRLGEQVTVRGTCRGKAESREPEPPAGGGPGVVRRESPVVVFTECELLVTAATTKAEGKTTEKKP